MVKILIGLLAAAVIAVGGYFGLEIYMQQQIATEVDAAFATCGRAAPRRATARSRSTCGAAPSRSRTSRANRPRSRR